MEAAVEYDSQGPGRRRVLALAFRPGPAGPAALVLRREGLWQDGERWVGPREQFEAALTRLAAVDPEAGRALASALGTPIPAWVRAGGATAGARAPVRAPGDRTLVMGILNVTPDSFYDGGRYADPERALARAREMVAEGADIIDVGGESTRPNAEPVPAEEELRRVVPVVEALAAEVAVPISVDTYKAQVAEAALKAGARMVNDISGLQFDPRMVGVVAEHGASLVVMHIKGTPRTMQLNPVYGDVVREVRDYLARACEQAIAAGVAPDGIWVDPGIGFGKNLQHNLTLLAELRSLRALGFPVLVGTSNKSMIGRVLGVDVHERTEGTAATVAVAVANGADAVRVHDVRAMGRVVRMTDAVVRGWQEGEAK